MSTINGDLEQIIKTKTGLELYKSLHVLHATARQQNEPVTYPDTDPRTGHTDKVLDITILGDVPSSDPDYPNNWKRRSIPLSYYTDFNGWTFRIISTNNLNEPRALFYLAQDDSNIHLLQGTTAVRRESIDNGHFTDNPILKTGKKLLLIEDQTPWTYWNDTPDTYYQQPTPWAYWNYDNPRYRRDVLLIKNGIALNRPIASYSTVQSDPSCSYVELTELEHVFKNVNMIRTSNCSVVVNLLTVKLLDNVTIENVSVNTPANSGLTHDNCIWLINATNITVKQFCMDRTYSLEAAGSGGYGYGILMDNVWNSTFKEIESQDSEWGFFGCNNVNTANLEDCEVNRFDIHCYGRDITCRSCTFAPNPVTYSTTGHAVNRYSSLFGYLIYDGCEFENFVPFKTDYAYNIYAGCDILFKDCTLHVVRSDLNRIIEMGFWGAPLNARQEHVRKCAHNVAIENLTIQLGSGISQVYLFFFKDRQSFTEPVYHTSYLSVTNLTVKDAAGNTLPSPYTYFAEKNLDVTYVQRVFRFKDKVYQTSF